MMSEGASAREFDHRATMDAQFRRPGAGTAVLHAGVGRVGAEPTCEQFESEDIKEFPFPPIAASGPAIVARLVSTRRYVA